MNKDIFLRSPKICCISDIHLGVHQSSSQWHDISLAWAKWLKCELIAKGITDIVISGDLFHYRDHISVSTLDISSRIFELWKDFNIIIIAGNHDAFYKDRCDVNSISIFNQSSNISTISSPVTTTLFSKNITFCPWNTDTDKIPVSDIIFGHFQLKTFKQTNYRICSEGTSPGELTKRSKLTITGHFHLREERQYDSSTIIYLGNPFQMDFGDVNDVKGYYILDIETLKYEFFQNTISPTHKFIYLTDIIEKQTNLDLIKGNFTRLIIDRKTTADEIDNTLKLLTSHLPVSLTVDYRSTTLKPVLDQTQISDMSQLDIPSAIEEFVNQMNVDNKKEIAEYTIDLYKKCK